MSLKPYTRHMLSLLKANNALAIHAKRVNDEVKRIYTLVLEYARISSTPLFTVEIPMECYDIIHDVIYDLNMAFPDSTILRKVLTRGVDGNMYDSSLSVDPNGIRLQKKHFHKLYITIDWS